MKQSSDPEYRGRCGCVRTVRFSPRAASLLLIGVMLAASVWLLCSSLHHLAAAAQSRAAVSALAARSAEARSSRTGAAAAVSCSRYRGRGYTIEVPDGLRGAPTGARVLSVGGEQWTLRPLDSWASADGRALLSVSCENGSSANALVRRLMHGRSAQPSAHARLLQWQDPDTGTVWLLRQPARSSKVWIICYTCPADAQDTCWQASLPSAAASFCAA